MRTDRCVDAAGHVEAIGGDHLGVQVVTHAVQLLVLVGAALRDLLHRGDGGRVVGGEHRVQHVAVAEQPPGAGQVGHVGVLLAGEHRVAGQAVDLRALDLRVPVGALDQAYLQAVADAAGQVGQVVDRVRGALLVGLHHDAEAFPALERRIADHPFDDVQRKLQAVGFLGVDGAADAVGPGQLRQFQHARYQVREHALALGMLIARVQRRELDRDAMRAGHVAVGLAAARQVVLADGVDRAPVVLQVAQRVLHGQRAFAEHVEGVAVVAVVTLVRARQGLVDGAAHDELVAHDLHCLAHGQADYRFTDAADQALEGAVHVALGVVGQVDQVAGQHQAPGRGVDQHRIGLAHVALPVGFAELVADQLVGGFLVGDAQQRLGHAHQQHALLAAQVVLAHERLDRALVAGACAYPAHQVGGGGLYLGLFGGRQAGLFQQFAHMAGLVLQPGIGDGLAQGGRCRRQFGREQRPCRGGVGGRCCIHGHDHIGTRWDSAILILGDEFPSPSGGCPEWRNHWHAWGSVQFVGFRKFVPNPANLLPMSIRCGWKFGVQCSNHNNDE